MSCDWEGNRRSGVALAMHHRLEWFIHLRAHGLSKGDGHPTNTLHGVWYSLPLPIQPTHYLEVDPHGNLPVIKPWSSYLILVIIIIKMTPALFCSMWPRQGWMMVFRLNSASELVKVLHRTRHNIGHFRDALPRQSLN